jgi:ubiquinone/menaquinone biosynthesis C-methylase UbiE
MRNLSETIEYLVRRYYYYSLENIIARELKGSYLICDIGCGKGDFAQTIKKIIKRPISLYGCDIWKPYIDIAQDKKCYSDLIQCDIKKLPYQSDMFDAAIVINVIEHLDKNAGYEEEFCRISNKKVIITTCKGYWDNPELDDNPHQKHLSGHSVEDFRKMGYIVYGYGSRFICGEMYKSGKIPNAIRPVFSFLSHISTCITYYFPSLADLLICVKDKK